jgi:3-phosphoshikimate 1-carboxyvinyltransferase
LPYVEMTTAVMKHFGVQVQRRDSAWTTRAGQRYRPSPYPVEADASGASYFLAAAAMTGGTIVVEGLSPVSLQGDSGFLRVLTTMGCGYEDPGGGIRITAGTKLHGISVDMNSMPDVVPTLAVLALFAEGETRIRNVGHLRYKESDRLAALATELRKVGAEVRVSGDDLEIVPVPLHGAFLETYDDHRLAMSFALIGLRVPGIRIENPGCVKKSFPAFWGEFEKLYKTSSGAR